MSTVGLDVGTSRVKAVRFDAGWAEVDTAAEDTVVLSLPGGRREQSMDEVWAAAVRGARPRSAPGRPTGSSSSR